MTATRRGEPPSGPARLVWSRATAFLVNTLMLALLVGMAFAAAALAEERVPTGAVSGVVSKADNSGVSGIEVSLFADTGAGRQKVASATTAGDGTYTFSGLASGSYWLGFLDPSGFYVPEFYNNKPTLLTADGVTVTDGATTQGINAKLAAYGALSGQVKNAANKAIPNIEVNAYVSDGFGGWQWAGGAHTAINGRFTIDGLLPGAYRVGFSDATGKYLAEFYSDKHSLPRATDVVVWAGQVTINVNARLNYPGSVLGKVTNADGEGVSGITVRILHQDGGHWDAVGTTVTQGSGGYLVENLPDGVCRVQFRDPTAKYLTQFYSGRQSRATADDVQVDAGEATSSIDAELVLSARLKGNVTKPNGNALLGIKVFALRKTGSGWKVAGQSVSNASGAYVIGSLAAGSYRVKFADSTGVYVTEYFKDQLVPGKAKALAVQAGAVRWASARLALAGRISGVVRGRLNKPLAKMMVTAFRKDGDDWLWAGSARTGPTGAYRLVGLAEGTYRVRFADPKRKYTTRYFRTADALAKADNVTVRKGHTTWQISARLVLRPVD